MPKIQIEEADHTRLVEAAGRVDALNTENATLTAENKAFKEAEAKRSRTDRAHELIVERAKAADVTFDALQVRGLVADLPLTESGDLDETAFSASVDTEATDLKEAAAGGTGQVFGFGGDPGTPVAESGTRTTSPWGRSLTESKGA